MIRLPQKSSLVAQTAAILRERIQSGEWHADSLDGPGIKVLPNGERYEGGFRAGKRHGYGQLIGADEKVQAGRWEDGKLVESAP